VSRILLFHLRNYLPRHVEEAGHIGIDHQIVVFFGVVGECFRDVDSGIVHQQISTTEMFNGCSLSTCRRFPFYRRSRSFDLLIAREVATTFRPRLSSAGVTPRPIPLDAPVIIAVCVSVRSIHYIGLKTANNSIVSRYGYGSLRCSFSSSAESEGRRGCNEFSCFGR